MQSSELHLVCESDVIGMLWRKRQSRSGDMMKGWDRDREEYSTGGDPGQAHGDNIPGYLTV